MIRLLTCARHVATESAPFCCATGLLAQRQAVSACERRVIGVSLRVWPLPADQGYAPPGKSIFSSMWWYCVLDAGWLLVHIKQLTQYYAKGKRFIREGVKLYMRGRGHQAPIREKAS